MLNAFFFVYVTGRVSVANLAELVSVLATEDLLDGPDRCSLSKKRHRSNHALHGHCERDCVTGERSRTSGDESPEVKIILTCAHPFYRD